MISSWQQAFINAASPVFKKDPRILGVALSGDYARNQMDEYSGLDFEIAVRTEDLENVVCDGVEIAEKLGTLLSSFPATHIQRPNLLICMYANPLIHVDLNFISIDTIAKRTHDHVILFERENALTDEYSKQSAGLDEIDLQWYEDRFWIWVHYAATRIGRGELFDAIESLAFLRQWVLGPLLQAKNGAVPGGVRKLEQVAPIELPRLTKTLADHDAKSCLKALKAAADLYIYLRGINKAQLVSREDAEKQALQYLSTISDKLL